MTGSREYSDNKLGEKATAICRTSLLLLALVVCSFPAQAEYTFQFVNPPGADFTQTFGINDDGIVTGTAFDGSTEFSFTYNMETGEYEYPFIEEFGVSAINNSGVTVGRFTDDMCVIRDKKGNYTTFIPPSQGPDPSFCSARAISSKGLVTGFVLDATGLWTGFIYNPKKETFEEFLPSFQTIAQGINANGQNVGSTYLLEDEAYQGSVLGRYGYLRQKDGTFKYFAISQSIPGRTRARGISENAMVTGFYTSSTFEFKSYVISLSDGSKFENITLTDEQMVYQKPCNPDLPPPPSSSYQLFTDVTAGQVRNDEVVVGSCVDTYFDQSSGDSISYGSGFIATPVE